MPQATKSDRPRVTTAPNVAMFTAERRVRTLVAASTNANSGTSTMTGTAHGRVEDGSKWKPWAARAPAAAPEAAAGIPAIETSTLSEGPPRPPAPLRDRPRHAPRLRAARPSPDRPAAHTTRRPI